MINCCSQQRVVRKKQVETVAECAQVASHSVSVVELGHVGPANSEHSFDSDVIQAAVYAVKQLAVAAVMKAAACTAVDAAEGKAAVCRATVPGTAAYIVLAEVAIEGIPDFWLQASAVEMQWTIVAAGTEAHVLLQPDFSAAQGSGQTYSAPGSQQRM